VKIYLTQEGTPLSDLISILGSKRLPGLVQSIRIATNEVMREWVKSVENSNAKDGWKRKYKESINIDKQTDPMEASVSAKGMFVNFVEKGVKRFDMKPGLLHGPHARRNEKGEPYNIIFMRKFTPAAHQVSAMPKAVYAVVKKLDKNDIRKRYRVTGIHGTTPLMSGTSLQSRVYTKPAVYKGASGKDIYGGLVKTGSPRHTVYGTFRIVSKNSTGWIYPGAQAVPIYPNLKRRMNKKVKDILQSGLKLDIEEGLNFIKENT